VLLLDVGNEVFAHVDVAQTHELVEGAADFVTEVALVLFDELQAVLEGLGSDVLIDKRLNGSLECLNVILSKRVVMSKGIVAFFSSL